MGSNIRGQNARRNPVTSTMRPLRRMGPGTGFLQTRKEKKIHSTSLPKPWQCRYHLRKNPEEREFVIDSGTSMHMLSKKDQRSRNPVTVVTVNEVVQMNEDAPINIIYIYIYTRSSSLRGCALTRGHTCCPIARQTVRRARLHL